MEKAKSTPVEMQCITRQSYIAKQAVCTATMMMLYMLSGAALALGIMPLLLAGALPIWRIVLHAGFAVISAALWWLARWTESYAL